MVYDGVEVTEEAPMMVEYGAGSALPRASDQTGVTSSPEPERSSAEPDDKISSPPKNPSPPKKDIHEDFVIGCDRDPHTQAVGVHLAVVIREVTSKREELLGVGLVRKV